MAAIFNNPSASQSIQQAISSAPMPNEATRFDPKIHQEDKSSGGLFYSSKSNPSQKFLNPSKLDFYKYKTLIKYFTDYRIIYYTSFILTIIGLITLGLAHEQVYKKGRDFWLYVVDAFLITFGLTFLAHVIIFFYIKKVKIEGLIDTVRATMNIYSTQVANNDIHISAGKLLAKDGQRDTATKLANYFVQTPNNGGHVFQQFVNNTPGGVNYQQAASLQPKEAETPQPVLKESSTNNLPSNEQRTSRTGLEESFGNILSNIQQKEQVS